MFKIQPEGYDGLCRTCRFSQIVAYKGRSSTTFCHAGMRMSPLPIVRPVSRCTDYEDRRQPSMVEMEEISWRVTTDGSGRVVGFKPPLKED